MDKSFLDKIKAKWNEQKFVCVGLDQGEFIFDKKIIDQTADLVCAYKPNAAFYKDTELQKTVDYLKNTQPDLPIILDAKRADVENTSAAYAKAIFDSDLIGVDAVTVNPYLGGEALQPFLDRKDKGIFVLVKTSNPGAGEFQDLLVDGEPLYQVVAEHVVEWNTNGNLGVVMGATYPEELSKIRKIIGDMPILIPGIGAQGGDLEKALKNGLNSQKQGIIINVSRSILNAPNPREAALSLDHKIKETLK